MVFGRWLFLVSTSTETDKNPYHGVIRALTTKCQYKTNPCDRRKQHNGLFLQPNGKVEGETPSSTINYRTQGIHTHSNGTTAASHYYRTGAQY